MLNSLARKGLSLSMVVLPTLLAARKINPHHGDLTSGDIQNKENNTNSNKTYSNISRTDRVMLQVNQKILDQAKYARNLQNIK